MLELVAQTTDNLPWGVMLGPTALLAFLLYVVVWGGRKRWWVYGWQYEAKDREAQEWKSLALRSISAAESGVDTARELAGGSLEDWARKVDEARARGLIQ